MKFKLTKELLISFLAFTIFYGCTIQSAEVEEEETKVTKNVIPISEGFENAIDTYYHNPGHYVIVKEYGMDYLIDYHGEGGVIANLTKDSLEVSVLKTQHYKDSLQIEVFKKYLKNP